MENKYTPVDEKFSATKICGFYYIVDNDSGKKVITRGNGKPFRSKSSTKVSVEIFNLQKGYEIWLKQQGE